MAEEQNELRRIKWSELFPFTRIFKSFRMAACQPTKIGLALAAILVLFVSGWLLGVVWSWTGATVYPYEIYDYATLPGQVFNQRKDDWQQNQITLAAEALVNARQEDQNLTGNATNSVYRTFLAAETEGDFYERGFLEAIKDRKPSTQYQADALRVAKVTEKARKDDKSPSDLLKDAEKIREGIIEDVEEALESAEEKAEKLLADANNLSQDDKSIQEGLLEDDVDQAKRALTLLKVYYAAMDSRVQGKQIFTSFLDYEMACIKYALSSAWEGRIFSGLDQFRAVARRDALIGAGTRPELRDLPASTIAAFAALPEADPVAGDLPGRAANPANPNGLVSQPGRINLDNDDSLGFVGWMFMGLYGFCWMVTEHWLFAIVFLPVLLGVIALFGGAISRISALDFARSERISIGQGLRFSAGKFLSFFLSPVLALILLLLGGGLLVAGGFLIGSIPVVGEILMSILFFLALIMGMVLAFFLIGFITGGPLMYPTIAVEGSDSFDGISRSIMYVYSHPWHTLFYGVVTVIYGALTYLFVRLFLFLALSLTHMFVGWGLVGGGESLGAAADKLDVLWTAPTFDNLFAGIQWEAMSGWLAIWAFVLNAWVFLIAALAVAYLISFFFTASTVVYYLLRQKIDAVDMDDVYVEEIEEQEWVEPEEQAPEGQEPQTQPEEDKPEQPSEESTSETPDESGDQDGDVQDSQDHSDQDKESDS